MKNETKTIDEMVIEAFIAKFEISDEDLEWPEIPVTAYLSEQFVDKHKDKHKDLEWTVIDHRKIGGHEEFYKKHCEKFENG